LAESVFDLIQDHCPAVQPPAYIVRLLGTLVCDCVALGDVHAELFICAATADERHDPLGQVKEYVD